MLEQLIKNSTPRVVPNGINDQSIQPSLTEFESVPFHCPLIYIQSPTGPEEPFLAMSGSELQRVFGADAIDPRQPYYNHATEMALSILAQGNACFIKRILRPTVVGNVISNQPTVARLTLLAQIDTTPINKYARDVDGNVILDVNGAPTFTATPVVGGINLILKWYNPGAALTNSQLDTMQTVDGLDSYPLLTLRAAFKGDLGNTTGVRMWVNNIKSADPADPDVVAQQAALTYSAQLVQKQPNTTPTVLTNKFNESVIEFCFKPNAYNYKTNADLVLSNLVSTFSDDGIATGRSPLYGPLREAVLHSTNIDTLLDLLYTEEQAAMLDEGLTSADFPVSKYMLDMFTGTDYNGKYAYGFQVNTVLDNLVRTRTTYLKGGNDGDLTNASFETQVISEVNTNYQNPDYPLIDNARYPFSAIIDSGYSMDVKTTLLNWLDYRPDVHVILGTHTVGEDQLTASEEISVGVALRNAALLHVESELWGTSTVRCVIMMQSGYLLNGRFSLPVSTVFETVMKRALYGGAGTGALKHGFAYNVSPGNQLTYMRDLTNTFLTLDAKTTAWSTGLSWAQSFDRKSYFFPAIQTVYPQDNSVLSGEMFMQICCDVQRQADKVWRVMVGDDQLTEAQFAEAANNQLLAFVDGLYDNRVKIIPNTYFSPADDARGYSWTLQVDVYGQVPKTVQQVTIVSHRNQ